jgi:YD repeat-containing protein
MDFPTKEAYLLEEEIKPNGNKLFFSYQLIHGKLRLTNIRAKNRTESAVLDELHFSYSLHRCVAKNRDGETTEYLFKEEPCQKGRYRKVLQKVRFSTKGDIAYHTQQAKGNRKVTRIAKPQGRFLEVHYANAITSQEEDKVRYLLEPCGEQGETIKTYQFSYHANCTEVRDALHHLTLYHFDENRRLSRIDYCNRHLKPLRQEVFQWSNREGEDGWLKAKALRLGDQFFYLKTYRYDSHGNVIRVALYGNLTGKKSQTFAIQDKDLMDCDYTEYDYTDDQRNLVVKKKTLDGLKTLYDYLPNTNLCTKVLQVYEGRIQERTFYTYDDQGQVIRIAEDNGRAEEESDLTDITFRKVKVIERDQTLKTASFGKPFQERHYYQNLFTSEMIFLRRKEFFYDDKGREIQQKVYNEHNAFCYEITKGYDSRGRLISESNPVGTITHYAWDQNDNQIEETILDAESNGKPLKSTQFEYDCANRLIRKTEKHNHGEVFVTSYAYNVLNQRILEIDPYGHETHYTYDRFGNQTQCVKPAVQDAQGVWIRPTIAREYNALDQVIEGVYDAVYI